MVCLLMTRPVVGGLGWVGLGWVGLGWVGLGWVGLGWFELPLRWLVFGVGRKWCWCCWLVGWLVGLLVVQNEGERCRGETTTKKKRAITFFGSII